ncbi:hypothetical protein KCU88_g38, partial [Aureobasidium melanogenum]
MPWTIPWAETCESKLAAPRRAVVLSRNIVQLTGSREMDWVSERIFGGIEKRSLGLTALGTASFMLGQRVNRTRMETSSTGDE